MSGIHRIVYISLTYILILPTIACSQENKDYVLLSQEVPVQTENILGILPYGKQNFLIKYTAQSKAFSSAGAELPVSEKYQNYSYCSPPDMHSDEHGGITLSGKDHQQITFNLRSFLPADMPYYTDQISISCNGKYLFYFDYSVIGSGLVIFDIVNQKMLHHPMWAKTQHFAVTDPTGNYAMLVAESIQHYLLWQFPGTHISTIPVRFELDMPEFSGNGQILLIGRYVSDDKPMLVDIFSTTAGTHLGRLTLEKYAISNDGRYLAAIDKSRQVLQIYTVSYQSNN